MTTVYTWGKQDRGSRDSHAEGDLKNDETATCEHKRGMFEVDPRAPLLTPLQPLPDPQPASLTSLPPKLPPSIPSGQVHLNLLAGGLHRVQ